MLPSERDAFELMSKMGSGDEFWETYEQQNGPPRPYSALSPTCPKCGLDEGITARYCPGWTRPAPWPAERCFDHKHPHLHRACPYCGYAWTEAPADGYRTAGGDMIPGLIYSEGR